jgi:hypothetical protein
MPKESPPKTPIGRGLHKHFLFNDDGEVQSVEYQMTSHYSYCIVKEIDPIYPDNPDLVTCQIISIGDNVTSRFAIDDIILCKHEDLTLVSTKLDSNDERLNLIPGDSASGKFNIYCIYHYRVICKINEIVKPEPISKCDINMY